MSRKFIKTCRVGIGYDFRCPYHAIVRIPIPCEEACPVSAIDKSETGRVILDHEKCINCGKCIHACPFGAILEKSELLDVLMALNCPRPVAAMLAPSVAGQFSGSLTELIESLRNLGFTEIVEVAWGADCVTAKEGAEFIARLARGDRFMTTSCCPAYVSLVEKHIPELKPFISHTPSPMRITAAYIKEMIPEAITVFIGPCAAKRAEAADDPQVDFVLTFEEMSAILAAGDIITHKIQPLRLPEMQAMQEGRRFAIAGGVIQGMQTLVGAVRLNGPKAEGKRIAVNWIFADPKEEYAVTLENGVLNHKRDRLHADPDATVFLRREVFNAIAAKRATFLGRTLAGEIRIEGGILKFFEMMSCLDEFDLWFNIVTPRGEE